MIRRALLAALVAGARALAPASSVWAQDGGNGKKKKNDDPPAQAAEETPPEKTAEQKLFAKIGKEFEAKDTEALVARVEKGKKVRILMGRHDGRMSRKQAVNALKQWFEKREIKELKLEPSKDAKSLTATFKLTFRRITKTEREVVDLEIRVRKDGDAYFLVSMMVTPR